MLLNIMKQSVLYKDVIRTKNPINNCRYITTSNINDRETKTQTFPSRNIFIETEWKLLPSFQMFLCRKKIVSSRMFRIKTKRFASSRMFLIGCPRKWILEFRGNRDFFRDQCLLPHGDTDMETWTWLHWHGDYGHGDTEMEIWTRRHKKHGHMKT
jgi:hypothetical protein